MEPTLAERKVEPLGEAEGSVTANPRPQEHEPAARPGTGGKLARNSETRSPSETCQVEPGGPGGKIQHLTRGDLGGESLREVSRGHRSEEGPVTGLERRAEGVSAELKEELTGRGK